MDTEAGEAPWFVTTSYSKEVLPPPDWPVRLLESLQVTPITALQRLFNSSCMNLPHVRPYLLSICTSRTLIHWHFTLMEVGSYKHDGWNGHIDFHSGKAAQHTFIYLSDCLTVFGEITYKASGRNVMQKDEPELKEKVG